MADERGRLMGWRERVLRWLVPMPALVFQVARLELRPGDRLIVTTDQKLSAEAIARLMETLGRIAPEGVMPVILDSGISMGVMRLTPAAESPPGATATAAAAEEA